MSQVQLTAEVERPPLHRGGNPEVTMSGEGSDCRTQTLAISSMRAPAVMSDRHFNGVFKQYICYLLWFGTF